MSSLNYPCSFQCRDCGKRMSIKRSDAEDLANDPDSHIAVKSVLKDWGWVEAFNGVFCPECAGSP